MRYSGSLQLLFCRVNWQPDPEHVLYVWTEYPDGTHYGAYPHRTEGYIATAEECGYGQDVDAYALEHEILHNWLPQELYGVTSRVLWPLAHGSNGERADILAEEALVIAFQRFMRKGELVRATAPGVNWFALRDKAIGLLSEAW